MKTTGVKIFTQDYDMLRLLAVPLKSKPKHVIQGIIIYLNENMDARREIENIIKNKI